MGLTSSRPPARLWRGFAYEHEHRIFCEHAALSGFENDGSRQFDISGLAGLTNAEFEALAPLRWPVNARWPKGRDLALFEDGRCRGWPGPPAAPGPALPRAARNAPAWGAVSLLLSGGCGISGTHHDPTGHVPRLQEAEPAQGCRWGPPACWRSAPGGGSGAPLQRAREALLLVGLDEGAREEAFLPMHWTDSQCSPGAVSRLIAAVVDPLSRPAMFKQGRECRPGRSHPLAGALVRPP